MQLHTCMLAASTNKTLNPETTAGLRTQHHPCMNKTNTRLLPVVAGSLRAGMYETAGVGAGTLDSTTTAGGSPVGLGRPVTP